MENVRDRVNVAAAVASSSVDVYADKVVDKVIRVADKVTADKFKTTEGQS